MGYMEKLAAEKKAVKALYDKGMENLTDDEANELKNHYAEAKRLQERVDLFQGVNDLNVDEAKLKRKEWTAKRAEAGYTTATNRIAAAVQKKTGMETRVCIPGHMQRGGSPSAYDRVLATQFGSYAAKLVEIEQYGVTVALVNNHVISNRLEDIAGKTRNIPEGCELLTVAKRMGISLG